jgi:hypothetical protein
MWQYISSKGEVLTYFESLVSNDNISYGAAMWQYISLHCLVIVREEKYWLIDIIIRNEFNYLKITSSRRNALNLQLFSYSNYSASYMNFHQSTNDEFDF